MAWMVRAAGIPARVAFGFTNGTSRDGDAMVLTNFNLHAWTEVYFAGVRLGAVRRDAAHRGARRGASRLRARPRPAADHAVGDPVGGGRAATRTT